LMEFNNYLIKVKNTPVVRTPAWNDAVRSLVLMLAPSVPHLAEELWHRMGNVESVHVQAWPVWSEELAADETVTLIVQINGKLRDRLVVPVGVSEAAAKEAALSNPRIQKYLGDKDVVKVVFAEGRLINIVVR